MLPVAFEALSVKTPHSGKSASAKQDAGGSTPFTEMIDDTTKKPDPNGPAASPATAKADSAAMQRATGHSLLSKSSSPTGPATLLSQKSIASQADEADGETPEPTDQKGANKATGKTVPNAVGITSTDPSANVAKQDLSGDVATELPANLASLGGKLTKTDTQPAPAKQSGAHSAKATGGKNLDGAAVIDQAGDGGASATAQTGTQPVAAAVAAIVDPTATTAGAVNSAEPQALSATSKSPVTSTGGAAGVSPDIAPGQPDAEAGPLGEDANPDSSAVALADLGLDEDLELPPTLSALAQVAAAHGKTAQAGASAKLSVPTGSQSGAGSEKPDAALPSEGQGLLPPSQAAAAPPATRAAELDLQKAALSEHDSLPQDASAAPKNSHPVASSAFSLNGITINIAAPAATPQDATAATAVAASPQSAPAALVPVSGIAVEIASKALADKNRFDIRLDPPELGRIHVRLDVDSNGQITSHVVADRSDTLDLLRRDAPALERALQDAGLKTSNNGLQFSLRDHGGFTRQDQPLPMPANARLIASDETLPAEITPLAYRPISGQRSGLDIRV